MLKHRKNRARTLNSKHFPLAGKTSFRYNPLMSQKPSAKSPKSGSRTVFWWVVWIVLTIGSFFLASAFWTPVIAKYFGSVRETKASVLWVVSVFGTWMLFLLPLMIVMYQKVDKVYDDARIRREKSALRFRSIFVEESRRVVSEKISSQLKTWPQTIDGGYLAHVILKNGQKVPNVFIRDGREILGVYDVSEFSFEASDVVGVEPVEFSKNPAFLANQWLRLDGVAPPA